MFTGLIEETGTIRSVRRAGRSLHLTVGARAVLEGTRLGDSIAVNGACLTVVKLESDAFTADVMPETYQKTSLAQLPVGSRVNLERTMAMGDRFGGHIVQGHVDGVGTIRSLRQDEIAWWLEVSTGPDLLRYIVPKGSIAIDGISLTVVAVGPESFTVSLIPHTWSVTAMRDRKAGDTVNLEADILAKYVERMLAGRLGETPTGERPGITESFLREHGFAR